MPTGCGAAWLARLLWEQEAPGSNPGIPTHRQLLASPRRFIEIVFELPPFVAGHIRMNQVIPFEPDINACRTQPVIFQRLDRRRQTQPCGSQGDARGHVRRAAAWAPMELQLGGGWPAGHVLQSRGGVVEAAAEQTGQ